jgi:hypothetical protein
MAVILARDAPFGKTRTVTNILASLLTVFSSLKKFPKNEGLFSASIIQIFPPSFGRAGVS